MSEDMLTEGKNMSYRWGPDKDQSNVNTYGAFTVREGSRNSQRRHFSRMRLWLVLLVAVLLAMIIKQPISLWNATWAFGGTYIESVFGDSTMSVSEVQTVLYGEMVSREVLGEATREISLSNVKVQISDSDILGLGSESMAVADLKVRARAVVRGELLTVKRLNERYEVTLPKATLDAVYIPIDEEIRVQRGRNLVTRLGDLVGDVTSEQAVRDEIAKVAHDAATADAELLKQAQVSAENTVRQLLSAVGIKNVIVRFTD